MPSWPWVDFIRCQWPSEHISKKKTLFHRKFPKPSLAQTFLKRNEIAIADVRSFLEGKSFAPKQKHNIGLVTFSHFLPNQQTLPDWKDLSSDHFQRDWLDHPGPGISAKFALVAGSKLIDEQVRSILDGIEIDVVPSSTVQSQESSQIPSSPVSHMHVFGHSHRPKDFYYKGIRYIHHPLGKPRERESNMISPNVDFKCIWDAQSDNGSVPDSQIIRYWDEHGGGLVALFQYMKTRRTQRRTFVQTVAPKITFSTKVEEWDGDGRNSSDSRL